MDFLNRLLRTNKKRPNFQQNLVLWARDCYIVKNHAGRA